jgi:hypothetical protein
MAPKPDEEYEPSACADSAIRAYWPDWLHADNTMFRYHMIELQMALIGCHIPIMFPADKRRAFATLKVLKKQLATVGNRP